MIRFFKISLKALQRFKTAAILNLLGLALAFTAFLVIVLHTWNEYNYDNYHPNKEHIFKVEFLRDNNTPWCTPPIGKALRSSRLPIYTTATVQARTQPNNRNDQAVATRRWNHD